MASSSLKRPPAPPPPPVTKYGGARFVQAGKKPLSRSLRLYQRIAVVFVGVTFLLLLSVLYLSVSRATIKIVANPKLITVNAVADVVSNPTTDGQITGAVKQKVFTGSKTFTLPSEGSQAVEAKASGTVTITNASTSTQALVATTRLLSETGVLFRIDKAITVPAGGKVDAQVHADLPGKGGEIGPSKFTIPGLNANAQKLITGSSTNPMVGGVVYVRSLTEKDVTDAVSALTDDLLKQAGTEFAAGLDPALNGISLKSNVVSQKTDVPVGTQTGAFTLTLSIDVTGVYYQGDLVKTYAQNLFNKRIPEGYEATKVNVDGMQVKVDAADAKTGEARISIYLDGTARLSLESSALSKDRFVGRSPNEVLSLLRSHDGVREVTVSFTPFWLKRVPTLKDHIKIEIVDPK
jgi:hypothetical protein